MEEDRISEAPGLGGNQLAALPNKSYADLITRARSRGVFNLIMSLSSSSSNSLR